MIRFTLLSLSLFTYLLSFSQENYELYFVKGDYERILDKSKVLADTNDYYWNSLILDKKGETLNSIEVLKSGLVKFPNSHTLETQLIDFLYKTGQYSNTEQLVTKYLDTPDMFLKYVNILGFKREYLLAIDLLTDRTKTDSLNIAYLDVLANYYYQADSLESSIKVLEKLISLNPNDQKNLNKLANIYVKTKNYEKAIKTCDLVLQNDSLNLKFVRIKGTAGFINEDYKLASNCFKLLLTEGDSGKFVLKHLGISQFRNNDFKESRGHLLLAYQVDSNDFETSYFLGNAFLNSQNPELGLFYLNRADSLLQPNPIVLSTIHYNKQSIYSAIGNYDKALTSYKNAYDYNPKPEYIFYTASLYQNKLDDKKKALEYYELFINLLPTKPASEHNYDEKQIVISLRKAAETNIIQLKEELFFKGELK